MARRLGVRAGVCRASRLPRYDLRVIREGGAELHDLALAIVVLGEDEANAGEGLVREDEGAVREARCGREIQGETRLHVAAGAGRAAQEIFGRGVRDRE